MKYNTQTLIRTFYFCFALIFSWLFANILLDNKIYTFNTLNVLIFFFIWLIVSCLIYKKIACYEPHLRKHETPIV